MMRGGRPCRRREIKLHLPMMSPPLPLGSILPIDSPNSNDAVPPGRYGVVVVMMPQSICIANFPK